MHTTSSQPTVETLILRALPSVLKDAPQVDCFELKDAALSDFIFCDEMFLDVLVGMAKDGLIVFDEHNLCVSLPASE